MKSAFQELAGYLAPFHMTPPPKPRYEKWDKYFMNIALTTAQMSRVPVRIGAVIVGPRRDIRATGYNKTPRGVHVPAEMIAVANAAALGVAIDGCALYIIACNAMGLIYGGPPCAMGTVIAIQAGIQSVVSVPAFDIPAHARENFEISRRMLNDAGIDYRELSASRQKTVIK